MMFVPRNDFTEYNTIQESGTFYFKVTTYGYVRVENGKEIPIKDLAIGDTIVATSTDRLEQDEHTIVDCKQVTVTISNIVRNNDNVLLYHNNPNETLKLSVHNKFKFVSADYSAQEPRLTAYISKEEGFVNAYKEGKDLYRVLASAVYKNTYEDNREHNEDGTIYHEGKERRSTAKKLLLGLTYGMGMPLLAQKIGCSEEEAQRLYDDFMNGFPTLKQWVQDTKDSCHKTQYVEGLMGRKRRLPDIALPDYTIRYKTKQATRTLFNPLLFTSGTNFLENDKTIVKYKNLCANAKTYKEKSNVKAQAEKEGIEILDNHSFIATAERQSVNAVIQGSAATVTKFAMINVDNDTFMREHNFQMLIPIHDEILGECPEEYADECAKRLTEIMTESADIMVNHEMPFKCDPTCVDAWYQDEIESDLYEAYVKDIEEKHMSEQDAFLDIWNANSEFTQEQVHMFLSNAREQKD